MLRLIGAATLVVVIVGPILLRIGLLEHSGMLREFVELEVRAFASFLDWARLQVGLMP